MGLQKETKPWNGPSMSKSCNIRRIYIYILYNIYILYIYIYRRMPFNSCKVSNPEVCCRGMSVSRQSALCQSSHGILYYVYPVARRKSIASPRAQGQMRDWLRSIEFLMGYLILLSDPQTTFQIWKPLPFPTSFLRAEILGDGSTVDGLKCSSSPRA